MRAIVLPMLAMLAFASPSRAGDTAAAAPAGLTITASDGALTAQLDISLARPAPGAAVDMHFSVAAPADAGLEIAWPDVRAEMTEALGEHVVEVESVRVGADRRSLDARLRLYDEGDHALPPLTISARRSDGTVAELVLAGASLQVAVDVPADAEPAPARDGLPLEVPPAPFPWLPAGAAFLAVLALAFSLARLRRRARVVPPAPPPPPPHERALAALRSLAQRSLPERGEVEPYFVELSEILRTYLEERFALRAPEQTTEEFLATVSHTAEGRRALESAHRDVLRDFLTRADLVKFARDRPGPDVCGAAGGTAERFVRETAPSADPEASAEATP